MPDFILPKGHIYTTDDVDKREQFDFWNEAICDEFVQLDCTRDGNRHASFHGEIRGCEVEHIQLSEVNADPQQVIRSKSQIAKATESEFLLSLQLTEVGIVNQDGRVAELYPGDFALYDSTRPYQLKFDRPFRQLVLQLPYDSLAERFTDPENLTARRVSAKTGVGGLASQFIQSVAASVDSLSSQDRRIVTEHVVELVAVALGSVSSLREVDNQSANRTALLERLRQFIEVNIRDQNLSASLIAQHHRISERYQRMLFASIGTTASRYILERRLELCHAALADLSMKNHSVTEIAISYGFSDAGHFSRVFKKRYAVSPTEYRMECHKAIS